jgi:hypothetical protein
VIEVQFHDELEYLESGIQKNLTMLVAKDSGEAPFIRTEDRAELKKRALESIQKNWGCRLEGTLNLPKVRHSPMQTPGTLTFNTMGPDHIIREFEASQRFSVYATYLLKKLEFGEALKPFELPVTHSSQTVEEYIKKLEGNLGSRASIQDFRSIDKRLNFYNHLKIIPIYVDDGTYSSEKDRQKYRYSLRSGNAAARTESPALEIYTEIEPINIVYTKNNMTFYDLMVNILVIVGGSIATIGVINTFYHYLFVK